MTVAAWGGAAIALIVAAAVAAVLSWCGPVDTVKGRSSHRRPTPTSGGLSIAAGACLGAAVASAGADGGVAAALAAACGLALFGAADDLRDYPPSMKFLAQTVVAVLVVTLVARVQVLPFAPGLRIDLPAAVAVPGSVAFLLLLLNAVNFMDGSNGLIAGCAAAALATLAAAAALEEEPAVCAAALAGAAANLGFLGPNLLGRLFQGDAGAFFSAVLIGGLGLILAQRGAATPWLVVFTVLPLLIDVLLTLLTRARRGARLTQAHREHVYQLWLQATGAPHAALAVRIWTLTALCCASGLALDRLAPSLAFAGLAVATVLLSAGWLRARRLYAVRAAA